MRKGLKGVSCYLDDILIIGKKKDEHFQNIEAVLKCLLECGVRVQQDKGSFFQEKLHYLGHIISANGIQTSPEKTAALLETPKLNNKQQLLSFLGVVNYYGKFVPSPSTLAHPFYKLMK